MPICPRGHESQAEDWCDFCGFPMTPPPGLNVPGAPPAAGSPFGAPDRGAGPGFPPPPPPTTAPPAHGGAGGYERRPYENPSYEPPRYEQPGYEPQYREPQHREPQHREPQHREQERPYEQAPYERSGLGGLSIGGGSRGGSPDVTAGLVTCPICRSPQTGRYCEECGYDYDLSSPPRAQAPAAPATPPPPPTAPPAPPAAPPAPVGAPGRPGPGGYGFPPPAAAGGQAPAHPAPPAPPYRQPGFDKPSPDRQAFERPAPQPFPEQPFPEHDGYERTGPVYAQPGPGAPAAPADDLGTSFRLAPPGPGQAGPGQAPSGRPDAGRPGQPGQTGMPGQAGQPGQAGMPPAPPTRTQWIAVVSADRDYFTDMMVRSGPEAAGLFFPPYCPERRIPLTGRGQLRIGRRSQQRGTVPEIDLSVPPEDPGASHQHAMLAEQPDGSWVLVDLDSTNGTTVNGGADPVPPHTAIPLADGDRVHVGAWTTITLHRA